ncbi:LysM peptidoglycan-binding domain-containing protein [Demequina sp. TTPB684]|uniref:LysM peptidoglycan-binding domain-containing protein n=1 Tax=unclassified Demequina TaxID=2620311 RepID=UPI001CF48F36|nr:MULTISPECIES: LysM domain-containing protein [unclassified Demequina]MCB2413579.1 LysM peptidoglycan-binding domain-containing protein [Demequina sp. TTPB684]UPU88568.1 LysM peptidoglycan-binding domain-containing protein [Demequina sp. TMPB413]
MKIIGRLAAWLAVLGMPGVAWVLGNTAWALWQGREAVLQVDDLMAMGAAGFGAAVASYLAATGWAMVLGALVRGGRAVPRSIAALAPASWQRVAATALGLTMSAGLAAPALAAQSEAPSVGWGDPVASQSTASAPVVTDVVSPAAWALPDAIVATDSPADAGAHAVSAPQPTVLEPAVLDVGFAPAPVAEQPRVPELAPDPPAAPTPSAQSTAASQPAVQQVPNSAETYTVVHGDSLWRISAKLLGPEASDTSINKAWPELYAANAETVGSDPALIHPGLVLTVPAGLGS